MKDEYVDAKVNEVLAELLNRLRTSAEKHSEQSVNKLNAAIQDLRADMEAMVAESRHTGRGRRSSGGLRSSFVSAALAVLLLVGGVLVGQNLNVADKKPQRLKLALPAGSHVVSQQYTNDRLLVKYLDNSGKQKLGIYRLADGGQPFAIIDMPGENKANVSVP